MAEKKVAVAEDADSTRPSAVEVPLESAAERVEQAPAPSDKASDVYQVQYPNDNFVMEGMPVVTSLGTPLTDAQAKEILPAAEASGVRIVQVSE